ncbi:hypothetical protein [Amycolatopsis nalaikhensis]|uniref:Integral membrane protein n=1 Tax=Amycolatopsis nalaikhensis TaxID=715472 RepID=A0ABY8XF14_9PSEU|nr:hypothetical protein [Amycolatopsis sp. 2-2]WIV54195.1 hypothetical protein QP939_35770 [Amycolatopsis sp. 2-2]
MSDGCGPDAEAVTRGLGFDCHDVSPVVSVRFPWELANWTLPVLEVLIVGGAVFALLHAIRRHRAGDPVNLVLWCASLVYLFVTEPPLYFPEWFGLDAVYGFIFAHNLFTVQFMGDRLPLYIVAFYPVISQLAYELVRTLGIFRDRGPLAGAVAVAFACQVFYEPFDQVGPPLRWWAWNPANDVVNHPALATVPLTSMLLFASVSMAGLTYLVVRLTRGARLRWWRIVLAGVLTPLTMVVASVPAGFAGESGTARAWILGVELALVWAAGAWVVFRRRGPAEPLSAFARWYPALYLAGMALFWVRALGDGVPIGSGLYALACLAGAGLLLGALYRRAPARAARE